MYWEGKEEACEYAIKWYAYFSYLYYSLYHRHCITDFLQKLRTNSSRHILQIISNWRKKEKCIKTSFVFAAERGCMALETCAQAVGFLKFSLIHYTVWMWKLNSERTVYRDFFVPQQQIQLNTLLKSICCIKYLHYKMKKIVHHIHNCNTDFFCCCSFVYFGKTCHLRSSMGNGTNSNIIHTPQSFTCFAGNLWRHKTKQQTIQCILRYF